MKKANKILGLLNKFYLYLHKRKQKRHIMKVSTLKNKLTKQNISFEEVDLNGFNKDITFSVNGLDFRAGFDTDKMIVLGYTIVIGYDEASQETQRRFFETLPRALRYARA